MGKEFTGLLEASSLGTPAARRIRSMTSDEVVEDVYRRIERRDQASPQSQSPVPSSPDGQPADRRLDLGYRPRRRGQQRRRRAKPETATRTHMLKATPRAGFGLGAAAILSGLGYLVAVNPGGSGLLVILMTILFLVGFLAGALIVVAVGIKAEDKAAMRRRDGSRLVEKEAATYLFAEEPVAYMARGVRRLTGVGQRIGSNS